MLEGEVSGLELDYRLMGRRIAELRKQRGLTQEKLAERADLTNIYISHIEKCRSIPSLETVVKLCNALGVTPDALLLGASVSSPDYLGNELLQKLEGCTPRQRRLVNGFIDLLRSEEDGG